MCEGNRIQLGSDCPAPACIYLSPENILGVGDLIVCTCLSTPGMNQEDRSFYKEIRESEESETLVVLKRFWGEVDRTELWRNRGSEVCLRGAGRQGGCDSVGPGATGKVRQRSLGCCVLRGVWFHLCSGSDL